MNYLNRFSKIFPNGCLKRKPGTHQTEQQIATINRNSQLENNSRLSKFVKQGRDYNNKLKKPYDAICKFFSTQYNRFASKEDQRIHREMLKKLDNYLSYFEKSSILFPFAATSVIYLVSCYPYYIAGAAVFTIVARNLDGFVFGKNEKDIANKLKEELKPEVENEIKYKVTQDKTEEIRKEERENLIKEELRNIKEDSRSAIANQLIHGLVINNSILTKDEKEYLAEPVNPKKTKPIHTMQEWSNNLKHLNYINSYIEKKNEILNEINNSKFNDHLKLNLKNKLSSCKGDYVKQNKFSSFLKKQTESLDSYINLINGLDFINDNEKEHFINLTKNNLQDKHNDFYLEAKKNSENKNKIELEVQKLLKSQYINEDRNNHFIQIFQKEYRSCEFNPQFNSLINIKNNIENEIEFQERLEDATLKRLPPSEIKKIYEDYEKKSR